MMTTPQSRIDLTKRQRAVRRRISRRNSLPRQESESQKDTLTFTDRCKQVLAMLKWLKEAVTTLAWLQAIIVSVLGVGIYFYHPSSTPLLSDVFPQADKGTQFSWSYPENSVKATFDSGCAKPELTNAFGFWGNTSSGLRLQYGVVPNMQGGGWGVHWDNTSTHHFDASEFTHFSFWVHGVSGDELFEIGLKDTNARETKIESKDWITVNALKNGIEIAIPLTKFKNVDKKSLNNVSFSFNALDGSGTVCIDSMAFKVQDDHRA